MENLEIHNCNKNRIETAIALGNFDGVHLGHKKLIIKMIEAANRSNLMPSILLFDTHTKLTTVGKSPMFLTSKKHKEDIVTNLGVKTIYSINFDENLMRLKPDEFVKYILVDMLNTKLVVVGFDYRFGYNASGNVETLQELGKKFGFKVIVIEPIYVDGILVSSTKIRELIVEGNLELANKMLDRNFQIIGRVIPGNRVGRALGFPTANLELVDNYLIPKHGVYRTKTIINNRTYLSATSIGYNPTFQSEKVKIECHIIDFNEEIYDQLIYIEFIEYLRSELKFYNIDDLICQIDNDIKTVISRH